VHAHTTGGGEKGICYVESRAQIKTTLTLTRIHRAALAVRAGVSIYLLSDQWRIYSVEWVDLSTGPKGPGARRGPLAGENLSGAVVVMCHY